MICAAAATVRFVGATSVHHIPFTPDRSQRMKTSTIAGLSLALAAAAAPAAWADCIDGGREPTPAEKAFTVRLTASLKAAMPAAPAPLHLEREPQVVVQGVCKDTPVGSAAAMAIADYAASTYYADRVKVTLRANFAYPGANDLVLGSLPKKPAPFEVHNLVVTVDGHKAPYVDALKRAIDRSRLQALLDRPLPDTPPPAAWSVSGPAAAAPTPVPPAATVPERAPTAPDPAQAVADKAKDAVNRLRGLLGR
ncbi:MAG: hypothetical protein ABT20_18225 [Rubrivivax sp. SCN 70-15]|nr:MAG: hypothetical protein ABT20_18225 [Rubrivivax sp. SCN 70-15]